MALDAGAVDALNCGNERTTRMIAPDLMDDAEGRSADAKQIQNRFARQAVVIAVICTFLMVLCFQIGIPTSSWNLRTRQKETIALRETDIQRRLSEFGIISITWADDWLSVRLADGNKFGMKVDPKIPYTYQIRAEGDIEFGGDEAFPHWSKADFVKLVRADVELVIPQVQEFNEKRLQIEKAKASWESSLPASSAK